MFFHLTTIHKGASRDFIFCMPTLEEGLECINRIALLCDQLQNVTLIEENSLIQLPPLAFDGQPIKTAIKQLEQQWQEALVIPVAISNVEETCSMGWHELQASLYQTNIDFLQERIDNLSKEHQRLQTNRMSDEYRTRLLDLNDRAIISFQNCLARAHKQLGRHLLLVDKASL